MMTSSDLKAELARGTTKAKLVLRLIADGASDSEAWMVMRAVDMAVMAEDLLKLTTDTATDDGETYAPADARLISLAAKMSVEADELLELITAPRQTLVGPAL